MEDTLDGGPSVSDSYWWVVGVSGAKWRIVGVFHEVANELLGVVSGAASGLKCERDEVDVWISVEFGLLSSLGHVAWAGADCCNEAGLLEKGDTMATSRYVAEPLRLKTRSIRACSRCPFTTRVRTGTSCSMNTLYHSMNVSRLLCIWPLQHACDRHLHTDIHNSGAAVGLLVCCR